MTETEKRYITIAMAGWSADSGMLKRVLEYVDNMVESGFYRGHAKGYIDGTFNVRKEWADATGH